MASQGKLVVISGPSGAGKSSIVKQVLQRSGWLFSVSATTRAPRPGEQNGREYQFVSRNEFERMIAGGQLLEWAEVFGQLYGTPAKPVHEAIAAGKIILLDIDVQGGLQVHRAMPQALFILILPPDDETLAKRLSGRGTEDPASLKRRLDKAHEEINTARRSGVYSQEVVNDQLELAVETVMEIVKQETR